MRSVVLLDAGSAPLPQFLLDERAAQRLSPAPGATPEAIDPSDVAAAVIEALAGAIEAEPGAAQWSTVLADLLGDPAAALPAARGAGIVTVVPATGAARVAAVVTHDSGFSWIEAGATSAVAFAETVDDLVPVVDAFIAVPAGGA